MNTFDIIEVTREHTLLGTVGALEHASRGCIDNNTGRIIEFRPELRILENSTVQMGMARVI